MSVSNSLQVNTSYPKKVNASDLLNFDGNVMNWFPFRISFEDEVINNPNLMESKKRNLLLKVLQKDALDRAMDLVRQGKTLQSIWSALNTYYSNPSKFDEHLSRQIQKMAFVNTPFETSKIENMLKEIRRLNSSCSSLGAAYVARSNSLVKDVLWKCGRPLKEKLCHVESLSQLEKELEKLFKSAMCLDSLEQRASVRTARPSQTVAATTIHRCIFCQSSNHASSECQVSMSIEEKKRIMFANNLCFKCLTAGHRANSCSRAASIRCRTCNGNHPTVLHQVRIFDNSNHRNNRSLPSATAPNTAPSSSVAPVVSTPSVNPVSSSSVASISTSNSISETASSSIASISSVSSIIASVHPSSSA
ncbi:hypothetical protein BLA29_006871, partial [Euroglyphus maynei]